MLEYKPLDIEHNTKVAIKNLREAYFSDDYDINADEFKKAEDVIIDAILFYGYELKKKQ